MSATEKLFHAAADQYAELGVDPTTALDRLRSLRISLQCWQGDDVTGFENRRTALGGGLAVTGAYPGRARNASELRQDLDMALSLIPGKHRVNLHASYGDFEESRADRDAIEPAHFETWVAWAQEHNLGLDFNPTFFAHSLAEGGLTLAHPDAAVREFWIEHGKRCRHIAASFGQRLHTPSFNNVWIPDGSKDLPADRKTPRERLAASLDEIFKESFADTTLIDSVESKLFGIGAEAYTVGSHEFYFGYAASRQIALCLDSGHFHPTESIADKITSTLQFIPSLLLHVSRGVRWDSDHVVTFTDELQAITLELARGDYWSRTGLGLDFFDASINRVAAWVIGARAFLKALLFALLEPSDRLRQMELEGDLTGRLALMEELKAMPLGAVWNYYCEGENVPAGLAWLEEIRRYDATELQGRT